jgi:hypothetical protein
MAYMSLTCALISQPLPGKRQDLTPKSHAIGVQIAFGKGELQAIERAAGATLDPSPRLLKIPLRTAEALGLKERVRKPQD